jgi:RNA polymerase sigma-70 factor (ECF subfamily)
MQIESALEAARAGDEAAFEHLVGPYRRELHAHCYRLLASLHDAEDAMQEAMLRVWKGLDRFEERSSLRAWLYKIATNVCLDLVARRKRRLLPEEYAPKADPSAPPGGPVAEPVWIEPYPDEALEIPDGYASPEAAYEERESLELAFVAALQYLAPRQRAALILREVLGFSAKEVGETLDTSVSSVNSALQRARETIDRRLPDRSQQDTLRSPGDARMKEIVDDYMEAMRAGDVPRVVSMLAETSPGRCRHSPAGTAGSRRSRRSSARSRSPGSGCGATARPSPTANPRWARTPGWSRKTRTFPSPSTSSPSRVTGSAK